MSLGKLRGSSATVGGGKWHRFVARFDWPLFVAVAIIVTIGLVNLYSATFRIAGVEGAPDHSDKLDAQIRWVVIGFGLFFATTLIDYRNLTRIAWLALCAAIVGAVIVLILGQAHKGAQRWISLGFFRVQPAEIVKIAVILAMAQFIQQHATERPSIGHVLVAWLLIGSPVVLVAAQPDLGSGILIYLIIVTTGLLCLRNIWPMVGTALVTLACLPIVWEVMRTYQKNRVLAFLDPSNDPTGDGWHTRQSIYAVGSGRFSGKGFMEGTQSQFSFLPEQWTDFPFSVWAEEWGFLGSLGLLVAYGFLIVWCINIGLAARDRFGAVICVGVAAFLFWHVIINICMVLGLAPVVGVTLPLVSYGGSSMITFFLGLGLVSSISMRRHGF